MACNPRSLGTSGSTSPRAILFKLHLCTIIARHAARHAHARAFRCVARKSLGFNSRAADGPFHRERRSLPITLFLFRRRPPSCFPPRGTHRAHNRAPGIEPAATIVGGGHQRFRAQVGSDKEPAGSEIAPGSPAISTWRTLTI